MWGNSSEDESFCLSFPWLRSPPRDPGTNSKRRPRADSEATSLKGIVATAYWSAGKLPFARIAVIPSHDGSQGLLQHVAYQLQVASFVVADGKHWRLMLESCQTEQPIYNSFKLFQNQGFCFGKPLPGRSKYRLKDAKSSPLPVRMPGLQKPGRLFDDGAECPVSASSNTRCWAASPGVWLPRRDL